MILLIVMKEGITMNKYKIMVTETLSRIVEVDATNEDEAIYKVEDMYKTCDIVLDDSDLIIVVFKNLESEQ